MASRTKPQGNSNACWRVFHQRTRLLELTWSHSRHQHKGPDPIRRLEQYWQQHGLHREVGTTDLHGPENGTTTIHAMNDYNSDLLRSDADLFAYSAVMSPSLSISQSHPALSMPELLDTFGPLLFPLHRALLLRKRVLLISQPPVHRLCHFGKYTSICPFGEHLLMHSRDSFHPIGSK